MLDLPSANRTGRGLRGLTGKDRIKIDPLDLLVFRFAEKMGRGLMICFRQVKRNTDYADLEGKAG